MKWLNIGALVLLIIGGLNWLSIGLGRFNFVDALLGATTAARFVYTLVGIAAIVVLAQTVSSRGRGDLMLDRDAARRSEVQLPR